jgi:N-acetylglucosaminyl-diphospho-decaprenol L-rhamnosyltransferase
MKLPTLSIIIVNWNAGEQLRDCIASISRSKKSSLVLTEVIIVDNGSDDGSLNGIELFDLPFKIILNKDNLGFGAACNQGAAEASSEYFLFLNPDTRLFENSLSAPISVMEKPENKDVGIVGIQLIDDDGNIARSCSRFPSLKAFIAQSFGVNRLPKLRHLTQSMDEWAHDMTIDVDQVIGAFFLIRQSLFKSLDGFDQRFFVYFEEVDLSYRSYQAGYRSVYLSDTQAFHAGCGTSDQVKARRLFYSLRSRIFYGFKHFTAFHAWSLLLVTLIFEPFTRVFFSLMKGRWREVLHTLHGYMMLINDLRAILRKSFELK